MEKEQATKREPLKPHQTSFIAAELHIEMIIILINGTAAESQKKSFSSEFRTSTVQKKTKPAVIYVTQQDHVVHQCFLRVHAKASAAF